MITLRNATQDDAPFVGRAILEAVGITDPSAWMLDRQAELCRRTDVLYSWQHALVAESDGQVVGSLTSYEGRHYRALKAVTFPLIKEMCGKDFSGMDDETAAGEYYLDSLYVVPEFRKQGVGSRLVRAAMGKAERLRAAKVALLVSPGNPSAEKLYRTLGFTDEREVNAFGETYRKLSIHLKHNNLLEVCAASVASAFVAERAGAPRIELCRRLDLGGLTPAREDIAECVKELSLQTFVLIRPRGGDFCYTEEEFSEILDDIRYCKSVGVPGVVIGFLNEDLTVREDYCRRAVAEAWPMQATFHRAFDRCADWRTALERIIALGFSRILTSGQQATAEEGLETLKAIVKQAGGRIAILAGSGINADNVRRIICETGVSEVHGSCKTVSYESDEEEVQRILKIIQ